MSKPSSQRREWSHFAAILVFALCVVAGSAFAQAPTATCRAVIARDRALVDVELSRFVDARLAKLVRLGLAGRIQLELVLLERRPFWFDGVKERTERETVLRFDRVADVFRLDTRTVDDPLRLILERVSLQPADGLGDGDYRVEVKVALRVVTPQSLGKVAAWLAGREEEGAPDALLRAVAEDLARTATARCEATRIVPRSGPAVDPR